MMASGVVYAALTILSIGCPVQVVEDDQRL